MNDVKSLLHIEAIKNLRIQYSHYLDTNQMDKVAALFRDCLKFILLFVFFTTSALKFP